MCGAARKLHVRRHRVNESEARTGTTLQPAPPSSRSSTTTSSPFDPFPRRLAIAIALSLYSSQSSFSPSAHIRLSSLSTCIANTQPSFLTWTHQQRCSPAALISFTLFPTIPRSPATRSVSTTLAGSLSYPASHRIYIEYMYIEKRKSYTPLANRYTSHSQRRQRFSSHE